jgi:O-methyltransferase/methyltransferase family protein
LSEDVNLAVLDMIFSYWKTQILRALANLSVADILARGPATLESLTEETGANKDGLARLLRAAASIGMVGYADGRYLSTSRLDVLREDAPVSLRAMAIAQGAPGHWLPWGRFPHSVMTGEAQSRASLGHAHFDYYARTPEEAGQFIKAMQGSSELVQGEVVRLVDIKDVKTAVDVGGANGSLVCALAKASPNLKGVVYDLPHSRDGGLAYIAQQGLSDRIGVESGDFFTAAPIADLYLLKFILHDWDDASAVRILTNIRRAMNPGGRVVLVEMRLGDIGEPGLGPLVDVNMMAVTGGRERTRDEYQKLLAAAELKLDKVTPTQSPFDIFEALAS